MSGFTQFLIALLMLAWLALATTLDGVERLLNWLAGDWP